VGLSGGSEVKDIIVISAVVICVVAAAVFVWAAVKWGFDE